MDRGLKTLSKTAVDHFSTARVRVETEAIYYAPEVIYQPPLVGSDRAFLPLLRPCSGYSAPALWSIVKDYRGCYRA